jgi:exonuclease III
VQSLQTEERLQQLLAELETLQKWDAILLNETWRELKEEQFETSDGHLFMASGGTKGQKGVAIVVHRRWKHTMMRFWPVNERLCSAYVTLGTKRFALLAVYMPHGSCPNNEVEQTYVLLTDAVKQARKDGRIPIICGDWNAVVGRRRDADSPDVVGEYGIGVRNPRGDWYVHWSVTERMRIVSTHFEKGFNQQWTYLKGRAPRQIDYVSMDFSGTSLVKDAEASDDISLGMDHRATKLVLHSLRAQAQSSKPRRKPRRKCSTNWKPRSEEEYRQNLDMKLGDAVKEGSPDWVLKTLDDKCSEIELILTDVALQCRTCEESTAQCREKVSVKARALIAERRAVRSSGVAEQGRTVKQISKDLQRELRAWDRLQKRQRIDRILSEFKGLQKIASIKNNDKKHRLTSVKDDVGDIKYDRQEIVDVFASFYESLYAKRASVRKMEVPNTANNTIARITAEEIRKQLCQMKNGKSADTAGIVAEMIKVGGPRLQEILAAMFNDILLGQSVPPGEWKHTRIKVLLKKGDPQLPGNYRPIAILPILYKLFSRILYQRLKVFLEPEQSVEQAGFRSGFSCEDHLLTLVLLYEKLNEQSLDLWIAAVDFEKAFDSVSHESIWEALQAQKVPGEYIEVLQRLYGGQTAQISADMLSRIFPLERGTKQGDPLSPALFNAVLEHVMRRLKCKWKVKKYGIKINADLLNNLRFADDLLLIGGSRAHVKHMLEDLATEAGKVGLKLHMGKTKILSSRGERRGCLTQHHVDIHGEKVEVLPISESTMYLGRKVVFQDFHDAEISNRISRGWAAFGKFKNELCCKHYPLKQRIKLFDATVSATVLYGSGTWTMNKDRENTLRTAMRRMLRRIHGYPRKVRADGEMGETWVEWIIRATHSAENTLQSLNIPGWVEQQQLRKQQLADRVKSCSDNRWSTQVLHWHPAHGRRRVGRPYTRWGDSL